MIDEGTFIQASKSLIPSLYRISMSILRHLPDAQDAVQQGLLRAWAAKERAEPRNVEAWITKIVINECRNIQRHRMRIVPVASLQEPSYAPPDSELANAMASLPEKWRLPLMLKYMERYTEKEIGQALSLSIPTVKSRLFRARKALGELLSEEVEFR